MTIKLKECESKKAFKLQDWTVNSVKIISVEFELT